MNMNKAITQLMSTSSSDDDEYKEIVSYNELMDFIQKNMENDAIIWKFWKIVGH